MSMAARREREMRRGVETELERYYCDRGHE